MTKMFHYNCIIFILLILFIGCSFNNPFLPTDIKTNNDGKAKTIFFKVIYRDFIRNDRPGGHPNFEVPHTGGNVICYNIVLDNLGVDGKPVYNTLVNKSNSGTTNTTDFHNWFHDSPYSIVIEDILPFDLSDDNMTYTFGSTAFTPIDDKGWVKLGLEETDYCIDFSTDESTDNHNFNFTTEVTFDFIYRGNEELYFKGDDDLWVFINDKLAIDIGGLHQPQEGSITLEGIIPDQLGLEAGKPYEIKLFHAERHTYGSSFKFSLKNVDFIF